MRLTHLYAACILTRKNKKYIAFLSVFYDNNSNSYLKSSRIQGNFTPFVLNLKMKQLFKLIHIR